MITIKNKYIERDIELDGDRVFNLVIENSLAFRNFIINVRNQIENNDDYLAFYNDNELIDVKDAVFLVDNIFDLNLDEKKIATFVQKDISTHIDDDKKIKYQELINAINEYVKLISYDYDLPVTYNSEISLTNFLKAISVTSSKESDSFLENLLDEIKKLSIIFKYKYFIFVNLENYLTIEEYNLFKKEMKRMELMFFIVSGYLKKEEYDNEIIIIDNDLCEIYK